MLVLSVEHGRCPFCCQGDEVELVRLQEPLPLLVLKCLAVLQASLWNANADALEGRKE